LVRAFFFGDIFCGDTGNEPGVTDETKPELGARSLRGSGTERYTAEEIDFLVAYVVSENAWYVVRIESIGTRQSLWFYPTGSQRGLCRYETYREAWHLLKDDGNALHKTADSSLRSE